MLESLVRAVGATRPEGDLVEGKDSIYLKSLGGPDPFAAQDNMITPREFAEKTQALVDKAIKEAGGKWTDFTEDAHIPADALLCEVLRGLGYGEGVDIFEGFDKWYE